MKYPILIILVFFTGMTLAFAQVIPIMRISVENTETHFQTRAVQRFADDIREKLKGRIDVQFFSNARLLRDSDVIQALGQGRVEMAVPGTWNIMQFEPDVGVFLLPVFYGRAAEDNYRILDSAIGGAINTKLEKSLHLKVLGKWMDLGYAHLFGIHKKIQRHEDIQGLRIRVAGGTANKLRIQALGGHPVIIPWPDLPEYMRQGKVDGILTSYETVKSAKLWEHGVKYVFEDREYFPQYIPLIRASFWEKLTPDIQNLLTETWKENVDAARLSAAEAQKEAKKILMENGVDIIVPEPDQMEKWRNQMLLLQDEFIRELRVDPELVGQINAVLKGNK
jgi:C4-dicarboxylate-binding protein DctP